MLFHGVGDDAALMWVYNAAALGQHFRVYAPDTLGGPGKSVPDERYRKGFDDALWLDDVLDGLGLEQVSIAGVSHGGYLAQYYLLQRPQRVRRIVCMAASVPAGSETSRSMKTMLKVFFPEAAFPTQRMVKRLLRKLSGDNSAAFTDNPLILTHFTALMKGYNNMAMGFHMVRPFTPEEIDQIRPHALYLMGDADPFARLGGKDALLRCGMNAKFFARAGHGINHELPREIEREITDFLG
ncbi:MAG: alpha/beta hydrolase [Eubacteriales bacterium]|nr:alpha/beta hydrolase [Eubacteriales bacterium]